MGEPIETNAADAMCAAASQAAGSVADPQDGDGTCHTARPHSLRAHLSRRRHFPGKPRIWFELLLIGVSYWVYSLIRNAVPEQEQSAQRHAGWIWRLEQHLGVAVERSVNHVVDSVTWLITSMNYYYATLHFIVTIGVLVWVFRRHPGRYAAVRTALFVTTGIALLGYYFYPLAPPRLMTGAGFVDTVAVHHTWGSMASGDMAHVSNQYAAMPSMHIGWSLWCGVTIAFLTRHRWARLPALLYPLTTLVVIVATANHFFMDAVGGMACLAVGFATSRVMYGHWAFRFPGLPHQRPITAASGLTVPRPTTEEPGPSRITAGSR